MVKDLFEKMAKKVEAKSVWYAMGMAWLKQWERHVFFDLIMPAQ